MQPGSSVQLSLQQPQPSSPSTVVGVLSNPVQSDGRIQSLTQLGSPTTAFVLNSVSRNQANVPGETR
jgi:hypothetical protein